MDNLGVNSINALPSEIIILEASQVAKIGQELTESRRLNDLLQDKINGQAVEISALKNEIKTLQENQEILFKLVAKLKASHDLQPAQQDRAEVLRSLLLANGGKMFAKDARQRMRISKSTFSVLLSKMEDEIDKKPYHLKKNQIIISLK